MGVAWKVWVTSCPTSSLPLPRPSPLERCEHLPGICSPDADDLKPLSLSGSCDDLTKSPSNVSKSRLLLMLVVFACFHCHIPEWGMDAHLPFTIEHPQAVTLFALFIISYFFSRALMKVTTLLNFCEVCNFASSHYLLIILSSCFFSLLALAAATSDLSPSCRLSLK